MSNDLEKLMKDLKKDFNQTGVTSIVQRLTEIFNQASMFVSLTKSQEHIKRLKVIISKIDRSKSLRMRLLFVDFDVFEGVLEKKISILEEQKTVIEKLLKEGIDDFAVLEALVSTTYNFVSCVFDQSENFTKITDFWLENVLMLINTGEDKNGPDVRPAQG
jgi:hypothetical protein